MQATVTKEGNKAVIKLSGRFDFNTHRDFRAAYEGLVGDAAIEFDENGKAHSVNENGNTYNKQDLQGRLNLGFEELKSAVF
ncbi:MAG TPA: hypothetical protein PKJ66_02740, partial [Rhodocyclaceae bacterium]|nr:hypothetical protein [Rhodocyclaceae bacterium]